ncbi:MAG: SAM-dependent chlorinase/fluorinase, partial [candidate division WOR-3 bacterium]
MRIVAILTDFGNKDPFVGCVKGVILNYKKDVNFVDLTNEITPYDILEASFWIEKVYKYFP